jgi:hypothetical protein
MKNASGPPAQHLQEVAELRPPLVGLSANRGLALTCCRLVNTMSTAIDLAVELVFCKHT